MDIFGQSLSGGAFLFLLLALGLALSFEFVNGFHDTANAVATVIYTHTLRPNIAVVWSGLWNLIGVLTSSGAVAFGVVALLPVELVLNVGSSAGFAMVFALLVSAIIWNLGTWYLGLPASSSHTLVGSILGVGLANSIRSKGEVFGEGVNWEKAGEVGTSLLVSPVVGFCCAALLLLACKALIKRPDLYQSPEGKAPPLWIRGVLILTCTGVSFAHGSNDGQKGMGLIMLVLIGIVPATYAVNLGTSQATMEEVAVSADRVSGTMQRRGFSTAVASKQAITELSAFLKTGAVATPTTYSAIAALCIETNGVLGGRQDLTSLDGEQRRHLRSDLYLIAESIAKLDKLSLLADPAEKSQAVDLREKIDRITRFIPFWVKLAVAVSLGLGTMIGWKRIVVTVGEKIGKEHLTYAQGASAELVAMTTIGAADFFGLPVSTTHVLSSGIAGTMAASGSGLQKDTLRNLLIAWALTLPVCVLLGAALFAFCLNLAFAFGAR